MHALADLGDGGPVVALVLRVERQHDQGEMPVLGQELAPDDVVGLHPIDQGVVGLPFRERVREQRRRHRMAGLRGLPGREQRDDAGRAVDELEVRDEVSEVVQRVAGEEVVRRLHHENVELVGREAPRHVLVLPELRRVRPKQLRQRIVHLEPRHPEARRHGQDQQDHRGQHGPVQAQQADALRPEGDVDLAAAVRRGQAGGRKGVQGVAPAESLAVTRSNDAAAFWRRTEARRRRDRSTPVLCGIRAPASSPSTGSRATFRGGCRGSAGGGRCCRAARASARTACGAG